ncbi:hypothetical protein [Caulobacter sp. 1776]|uniref:hypothetical protein n=1 Tax=Caulobacter sp. 1776 TaxID=3156420 RepID=UPI003397CDBE
MRCIALIAALTCASLLGVGGAHADGSRESRYGPAPERAPVAMEGRAPGYTGQVYSGRALGWSGKREIVSPTAETASQAQPWWARGAQRPAPQPQQQPARAAYQPQAPAYTPPARDLPRNIYDAAPSAQTPAAQSAADLPADWAATAPSPRQQIAMQPGQVGARTYSVGRQFGMTPDAIPAAGPPRMVLIAPPAAAPDDEDKPREDDDRDWPAKSKKDSDQ